MGRRKSRTKPQPKKTMPKLDTVFDCPFCGHSKSVECKILKDCMVGVAECYVCLENFSTKANQLTAPIDVYYEWIDECERLNEKEDHRA